MITSRILDKAKKADVNCDCSLGNTLFIIAGIIGIATKNGYSYGFNKWINQEYFVNPLPEINNKENSLFRQFKMPANYKGWDIGFCGFDVPDNTALSGQFGSEKYFKHCEDLIRYYFTMKDLCEPYKDCILIHHRSYYNEPNFARLDISYYWKALREFPDRQVIVITKDVNYAKIEIGLNCEYVTHSPIIDFYLLTRAEYLIMCNSTFSWWGAWLSKAKTVAPSKWFAGDWKDCPTRDFYCDNWIII